MGWLPYSIDMRGATSEDSKKALERIKAFVDAYNTSNLIGKDFKIPGYVVSALKSAIGKLGTYSRIKGYKADLEILMATTDTIQHMPAGHPEDLAAAYAVLLRLSAKYMAQLPECGGYASIVDKFGANLVGITRNFMHTNNLDPELKSMYENFLAGRQF